MEISFPAIGMCFYETDAHTVEETVIFFVHSSLQRSLSQTLDWAESFCEHQILNWI